MNITLQGVPDEWSMADLATKLYCEFVIKAEVASIDQEQDEKPLHAQAAEILGHIHNRDYGLAELKIEILRDQLRKGDWTLGDDEKTEDIMKASTIHELHAELGRAYSKIENLEAKLDGKRAYIGGCEEELDVYRQDSEVLRKVVRIVKDWDDSTGRAFPTLYKILDELVDYTDASEGSPDTDLDECPEITISFRGLSS